jgi:hypothetical protein
VPTLDVETRSEENYRAYLRNHILPRWQATALGEIGALVIDSDMGALHESGHRLWLGPPKTPASARTITLPPFLVALLREHLATMSGEFVFTSPLGYRLRRSTFDRRVFRPAVDGDLRKGTQPVRPGLTFHGLRHSHKTWLIADGIPEIAQARRLGHHLSNRLVETYSHVAPEIEHRLLTTLEQRWQHAQRLYRPVDNRPRRRARRAPHTHPAQRTIRRRHTITGQPQATTTTRVRTPRIQEANSLPNSSISVHPDDHRRDPSAITQRTEGTLLPGNTSGRGDSIKKWS